MSIKPWRRIGWAALVSGSMAVAARWRRALTTSGALGALLTGTSIAGAGGWDWGAALVYFFASSTVLSRVASQRKLAAAADKFDKGSQRDLAQALANGGVAAALALLCSTPWGASRAQTLATAFAGALAAANADTWATEIGTLSPQPPRLITTGRRVAPGTSGGITPMGLAAAVAGAGTLGLVFALLGPRAAPRGPECISTARSPLAGRSAPARGVRHTPLVSFSGAESGARRFRAAALGGVAGALADSMLGATVQAMRWCPRCDVETERRVHRCGTPTTWLRGIVWVDNDVVNLACTLLGAGVGLLAGFGGKDHQ